MTSCLWSRPATLRSGGGAGSLQAGGVQAGRASTRRGAPGGLRTRRGLPNASMTLQLGPKPQRPGFAGTTAGLGCTQGMAAILHPDKQACLRCHRESLGRVQADQMTSASSCDSGSLPQRSFWWPTQPDLQASERFCRCRDAPAAVMHPQHAERQSHSAAWHIMDGLQVVQGPIAADMHLRQAGLLGLGLGWSLKQSMTLGACSALLAGACTNTGICNCPQQCLPLQRWHGLPHLPQQHTAALMWKPGRLAAATMAGSAPVQACSTRHARVAIAVALAYCSGQRLLDMQSRHPADMPRTGTWTE